jgi:hypothetical protein
MKKLGDEMWKEAMNIKFTAQKLSWFMRGGANYNDILNMSMDEIKNLEKIVEENLETTKKSKMPFF